ncbi:C40 family peptidase [Streptomyces sp. NPDC006173]|uniref:C40 family peptidase n=1 Tax=Streptomyces sp. NPDC006173 TaxID=3155349 RepID=UPI0033F16225
MSTLGELMVAKARTAVGKPYGWGAMGPNSFDCSGLINWVGKAFNIKGLPRTSQAMRNVGKSVPLSQIAIGDLVTFTYTDRRGDNPGPGNHVALYAGGGQVVQASGSKVNVAPLDTQHLDRVIRLPQVAKGGVIQAGVSTGAGLPIAVGAPTPRIVTAQQAGYAAEPRTGPYGAPVNPFKLAGFIASGSAAAAASPGGVQQASFGDGGGILGGGAVPWDGVSTMVLSACFVLGGVVLVVAGFAASLKPLATPGGTE